MLFEKLLKDAIEIRKHPEFTITYSGGIDSSLLLYYARPKEVYTLEGATQGDFMALPDRLGIKVNMVKPENWDKQDMLKCLEQPYYSWPPNYFLAREIGKKYRVVLDGIGADESLGGYYYYKEPLGVETYREGHTISGEGVGYDYRSKYSGRKAMNDIDLNHYLPYHLLWRADKMYMRFTIEGRHPFLDHRVVEYLFNLDEDLKKDKKILKLLCEKNDIPVTKKKGLSLQTGNVFDEIYKLWTSTTKSI